MPKLSVVADNTRRRNLILPLNHIGDGQKDAGILIILLSISWIPNGGMLNSETNRVQIFIVSGTAVPIISPSLSSRKSYFLVLPLLLEQNKFMVVVCTLQLPNKEIKKMILTFSYPKWRDKGPM